MNHPNDRRRILDMLAAGTINADEAERLLGALAKALMPTRVDNATTPAPEFLRVQIRGTGDGAAANVDVRIPIQVIRGGVRLASLLPEEARSRVQSALSDHLGEDIELEQLKTAEIDRILQSLYDFEITANHAGYDVRVWCE